MAEEDGPIWNALVAELGHPGDLNESIKAELANLAGMTRPVFTLPAVPQKVVGTARRKRDNRGRFV